MDVEVTADMWAAFEARYLFDLGLEEAIEQVLVPLIAAQVEAATIERCAKVAERDGSSHDAPYQHSAMFRHDTTIAVTTADRIATAIRSLSEGEKG